MSHPVYTIVADPENIYHDSVRRLVPRRDSDYECGYWRRVLRMAALCHDMGHLPFSHATETELLPEGFRHERLSKEIILSDEMAPIFKELKVRSDDVAKVAVGPKYYDKHYKFSDWSPSSMTWLGGSFRDRSLETKTQVPVSCWRGLATGAFFTFSQ
jgi:uncharacterized protein